MVELVADDRRLLKDLGRFIEPVEVLDADGKLLGLFVPANLERCKQLYDESVAKKDWAEIARRRARSEEECYTTKQVFEHLQSLTQDEAMRAYLQKKIDRLTERDGCDTP